MTFLLKMRSCMSTCMFLKRVYPIKCNMTSHLSAIRIISNFFFLIKRALQMFVFLPIQCSGSMFNVQNFVM